MTDQGIQSIGSKEKPLPLQIKVRGNYSRTAFSKKPFKIKLDKKQNLLGLTAEKSKHYALLAQVDDQYAFLKNFTAFNLGKRIGLPWTPNMQPVELVINNTYRGLYFLTESVRVQKGRVDIEELDDNATDLSSITGGYLIELDNTEAENQLVFTEKSCAEGYHQEPLRVTFESLEEYSEIQKQFITDQINKMNDAIGDNDDKVWTFIDLDDLARYYLVCEIMMHHQAFRGSTYLFRNRGENQKWHFSPLWDIDKGFENSTTDFFYDIYVKYPYVPVPLGNTWIPSIRCNEKFNNKVKETWLWFMSNKFNGLYEDIDEYIDHIRQAAVADHLRWKDIPSPTDIVDNSDIETHKNDALSQLNSKITWLKTQFGDFSSGIFAEPERDDTPAAKIGPAFSGVDNTIISDINNSEIAFYTLEGIKIDKPQPGNLYIMRQDCKVSKIVFR